jgi:small subunit ribosomal protein S4
MIRKKKMFAKPRKMYVASRIAEENQLVKKYGLKNKHEIWKTLAKINYYRARAKDLAKTDLREQELFIKKLNALGLKVNSLADVLGLRVEDLLDRRLTTIIANKGLSKTTRQARQMVVHKRVLIDGEAVNAPSYIVSLAEENLISVKLNKEKQPAEQTAGEVEQSVAEDSESAEEADE